MEEKKIYYIEGDIPESEVKVEKAKDPEEIFCIVGSRNTIERIRVRTNAPSIVRRLLKIEAGGRGWKVWKIMCENGVQTDWFIEGDPALLAATPWLHNPFWGDENWGWGKQSDLSYSGK